MAVHDRHQSLPQRAARRRPAPPAGARPVGCRIPSAGELRRDLLAGALSGWLLEGLIDAAPGPEARYEAKEAVALAFVAGLQHLAPRQRAVLVLRDVLGFHAGEVAEMLGTREASVTSALQRARASLDGRIPARPDRLAVPDRGAQRDLVSRFAEAFENDDIDGVVALLTHDALVSMPPEPEWHQGRDAIADFLRDRRLDRTGPWRFAATGANGQPAFAYYMADGDGWRRAGLFVVGVRGDQIASITRFRDTGRLSLLGVPERLQ